MSEYLKTNKIKVNGITYELEDSKTKEALENEILRARKAESDLGENLVSCIDNLNILQGDGEDSVDGKINKAISEVVGSAPEALNTIQEISEWIQNDETGTEALITRVTKLEELQGASSSRIENILWSNLIIKINKKELIPGQRYKIIDYITTTAQENTESANHIFDIVVEAVSESQLSEIAKACLHEGDTYFANNKIDSWGIKYCIKNDSDRFSWASYDGKGVIYWMKDEFGNEAPYDFKNIRFKTAGKFHYTFSYYIDNVSYDGTVDSRVHNCNKNVILSKYNNNIQVLNNNVFLNTDLNSSCINNRILNGSNLTISNSCCNINVRGNINNTELNITPNSEYEIIVSKNSSGSVKIYCEADLIF